MRVHDRRARSGDKGGDANLGVWARFGDGVAASTRFDPQAKALGELLRSRVVSELRDLVARFTRTEIAPHLAD